MRILQLELNQIENRISEGFLDWITASGLARKERNYWLIRADAQVNVTDVPNMEIRKFNELLFHTFRSEYNTLMIVKKQDPEDTGSFSYSEGASDKSDFAGASATGVNGTTGAISPSEGEV